MQMLQLWTIVLAFACVLWGEASGKETKDVELISRLLKEVENLKLEQLKTNEKYEKLEEELLDLKKEQVKWIELREQMEKTTKEYKSLLEKQIMEQKSLEEGHLENPKVKSDTEDMFLSLGNKYDKSDENKGSKRSQIRGIQKRIPSTKVAFYTDRNANFNTLGRLHTIIFDNVKTNIGNGYNKNDGIFTAPVAGTYVFSWFVMTPPDHYEELNIVVDGHSFARNFATQQQYDSGSKTVVMDLQQGNEVWIRTSSTNGDGFVMAQNWCSFTGWLLYPAA